MPKKVLAIAAVIAIIAVTAVLVYRRTPKTDGNIRVSGSLEVTSVSLSFKVPGRLVQRLVDEGALVSAGQTVARLEDDEAQQESAGRQADEKANRAALADLEAGSRSEEIAQADAALTRLKAEADKFAKDAERAESLFKREVIPRKELDAARAARESSAAAVNEAEQRLKLLKAGPRPDAVRQAKARTDASAAVSALAKTRLSQTILASPVSGLVLAKHAEPGEMLAAGSPVVTIGKMDETWLRAYIPETDLGRVKVGQQASVTVDTWPGRVFMGRVSFISSEAEFTPKNVQTEKERVKLVYRIKITLPNPKGELKPGMPADAVLDTVSKAQGQPSN